MPTARELLEQADALMRRNRARQVDTEIPELTEVVPMPVMPPAPPSPAAALDNIPELTDVVEEIEIASIVEFPDDELESNGWLRSGDREISSDIAPSSATPSSPVPRVPEPIGGRVLPLFAIAGKPNESGVAAGAPASAAGAEVDSVVAGMTGSALPKAPVVELPVRDATLAPGSEVTPEIEVAPGLGAPAPSPEEAAEPQAADAQTKGAPAAPDDWARWQALAEEIRMQVLQRIDLFTDTRLGEQLSAQMQPIVERASKEMVATINAQIGMLLRAYIADAIEREIEKWRDGNT